MKTPSRQTTAPKDPDGEVVSATEAAALLDVKVATLYAYVSRGLLRSRQSPGSKQKRYARTDEIGVPFARLQLA